MPVNNESIFYNLKVGVTADENSMQSTRQRVDKFVKETQEAMGGGQGSGQGPNEKIPYSGNADDFQKYVDKASKVVEDLKRNKKIDIGQAALESLTDDSLSNQSQVKILRNISKIFDSINATFKNKSRELSEIFKNSFPGASDDEIAGAVSATMQQGLGSSYGAYSTAGQTAIGATNTAEGIAGAMQEAMKNPETKKHMQLFGKYIMGYMASNIIQAHAGFTEASMMTEAQIQQRMGTSFDMTSFVGSKIVTSEMMMANEMQRAELQKQKYATIGNIAGSVIGAGLGGLFGGAGLPLGMMIGGAAGGGIGSLLGAGNVAELMKQQTSEIAANKFLGQMFGIAERNVGSYDEYEAARRKFQARTGMGSPGGSGLGYTGAELSQMGLMQAGVTGQFDQSSFLGQLAFARAYGYNPQEIFSAGISTRFTGQNVGAGEMMMRKGMAEQMGIGGRVPDLIQSLNQLAAVMTGKGVNVTEGMLEQFGMLPNMLFGNTARGRLPDMGMQTLMSMNNIFNSEPGSGQDAFLFQATMNMHGGDLWKFKEMKEQGIFGKGNLRAVMTEAGKYGNPQMQKFLFSALGVESPSMINKIMEKGFTPEGAVNEDFLKQFESIDTNTEEGKDKLSELLGVARDQVSEGESTRAAVNAIEVSVGKTLGKDIHQMQIDLAKFQGDMLKNNWDQITSAILQGMKDMENAMKVINDLYKSQDKKKDSDNLYWNLGTMNDYGVDFLRQNKGQFRVKMFNPSDESSIREYKEWGDKGLIVPLGDPDESGNFPYAVFPTVPGGLELENGKIADSNIRIQDIRRNNAHTNLSKSKLAQAESWSTQQREKIDRNGEGQGGRSDGINLHFHLSSTDRAGIHRELDEHLDKLAEMAHPRKQSNSYIR